LADQAKIDLVKINLPSWRVDLVPDWNDDTKIGTFLDTLSGNVNATVRQFWLDRVNATAPLTDVADVGASRPLSQAYQHAQEMLHYWDRIAASGDQTSKLGKIKQRYKRCPTPPYGLNPYGGVYVRTD
jgi:hypothetical protein